MTRAAMTITSAAETLEGARAAAAQAIEVASRDGWDVVSISETRTDDGRRVVTVVCEKGADE